MYKSSFELICSLVDNPQIQHIKILKNNAFKVKFIDEPRTLKFNINNIVMFLEILEAKEGNSK